MADADIASVAELLGSPSRAAIVRAMLDGRALNAGELAKVARLSRPATSAHLAKLLDGGLIEVVASGRHRYFRLANADVAAAIEALAVVSPPERIETLTASSAAKALRPARLCYDHLAGELGVSVFDALADRRGLAIDRDGVALTSSGAAWFWAAGIDVHIVPAGRRPALRTCLD